MIVWFVEKNCAIDSYQRISSAWSFVEVIGVCGMLWELAWKKISQPAEGSVDRGRAIEVVEAKDEGGRGASI